MENYIIGTVLIIALIIGVIHTVKHFRGEGGCCGGGSYKLKKKKLAHVQYQKTFLVEGMHCKHCKARVEEAVGDIKGVAGTVDLKKGTLTVSYAAEIDDGVIIQKVQKAGYTCKPKG